jgi:diketogulonate reductase-like aldo/keto reductase
VPHTLEERELVENMSVFDFELSSSTMRLISSLNQNLRTFNPSWMAFDDRQWTNGVIPSSQ